MDTNLILGITGFIATLFMGIAGIWYTLKYRKKVKLTFIQQECFSLFNTIVKNLNDIEIKYKDKEVNENLILLKGFFINSGNSDLDKNNVHSPLKVALPKNFSWKKTNIFANSQGMNISQEVKDEKLIFAWDLMKKNEYFSFDSLIEYTGTAEDLDENEIQKKLSKEIIFEHRITNLGEISRDEISSKTKSKKSKWYYMFLYSYFTMAWLMTFAFPVINFVKPVYELSYSIQNKEEIKRVKILVKRDKSLELKDFESDKLISKGTVDQIFSENLLIPSIEKRRFDKLANIVVPLTGLLILSILLMQFFIYRKEAKLLKHIE